MVPQLICIVICTVFGHILCTGQEDLLANIQLLHEAYRGKLITLFELDDDQNLGSPPDLSHALLEALVKICKTVPDHTMLPAGAALRHPTYGLGKITEVHNDGRRHVAFGDTGEVHVFATREALTDAAAEAGGASSSKRKSALLESTVHIQMQKSKKSTVSGPLFNLIEVDAPRGPLVLMAQTKRRHVRPAQQRSSSAQEDFDSRNRQFDTLLSKALTLTVVWNRPKLARKILITLEESSDEVGARDEVPACDPSTTKMAQ